MRRWRDMMRMLAVLAVLAALPACGKRGALQLPNLTDAAPAAHLVKGQG